MGVEDQFSEELAGDGVDDPDVEVLGEQDDAGSLVGSADPDVVQAAVVAQGDGAGFVDAVVADPVVGLGVSAGSGECFGQGVEAGCRCGSVWQGAVRSAVVVLVDEVGGICLGIEREGVDRLVAWPHGTTFSLVDGELVATSPDFTADVGEMASYDIEGQVDVAALGLHSQCGKPVALRLSGVRVPAQVPTS